MLGCILIIAVPMWQLMRIAACIIHWQKGNIIKLSNFLTILPKTFSIQCFKIQISHLDPEKKSQNVIFNWLHHRMCNNSSNSLIKKYDLPKILFLYSKFMHFSAFWLGRLDSTWPNPTNPTQPDWPDRPAGSESQPDPTRPAGQPDPKPSLCQTTPMPHLKLYHTIRGGARNFQRGVPFPKGGSRPG